VKGAVSALLIGDQHEARFHFDISIYYCMTSTEIEDPEFIIQGFLFNKLIKNMGQFAIYLGSRVSTPFKVVK
jgi:hypothetical protein